MDLSGRPPPRLEVLGGELNHGMRFEELLAKKGSHPRARSLRRSIRELGELNPEILTLVEDVGRLHHVARLEEARIASRSLPYICEEKEVKDVYRFVLEAFKPLVEKLLSISGTLRVTS